MYWQKKQRTNVFYCSEVIRLDIETAWNHNIFNPITWMVSARVRFLDESRLFRKPTELMAWYNELVEKYSLNFLKRIITIIHNASFDLSYLLPYIQHYLPKERPYGLQDSPNKIIMYRQGCFEFRCTYRLSNESLAQWSNEMAVDHPKKVGMYDYDRILYQDSELSKNDILYGDYDVLSMGESWENQLSLFHDNVTTVPLTSTGYVRRLLRKASRTDRYYRNEYFIKNRLDLNQHDMCLNGFAGGYVHQNRFLKEILIDENKMKQYGCNYGIGRDFRSEYPKHLVQGLLPVGTPETYYDIEDPLKRKIKVNFDKLLKMYPEFSFIVKFKIYALELKDEDKTTMPIFQAAKMYNRSDNFNYRGDNGRVIRIYSGTCETYMDNHTLKIFKKQYQGKIVIEEVVRFRNGYLPKCLTDPIDTLFIRKSELKEKYYELKKKYGEFDNRTVEAKKELDSVKKLLNAIFGCFATKPIKVNYAINSSGKMSDDFRRAELEEYYASRNNFLAYQIGCFIPALAKAELYEYFELIGEDKIIYTDTDSIYYMSNDDIERRVEEYNRQKEAASKFVIDKNGKKILYFNFDVNCKFKAFKGLHSKCYGYVDEDNVLKITISGVPERTIIGMKNDKPVYMTREEELSGCTKSEILRNKKKEHDPIEALRKLEPEFTFHINTGVRVKYVKAFMEKVKVDGHEIETAGGAIIIPLDSKVIKDETKLDGFDYVYEYAETEGVIDID